MGTVVTMYYSAVLKVIMAPLHGEKLIYLTPGGGFAFIFSATLYVTLLGLLPFLLYQIYAFLRPAIPSHVQISSVKVAFVALFLMSSGVAFGYFVAIPRGLEFLTTFASDYVMPALTAESYLNFMFGYALGIGLLFELPLILMLWHLISPLTIKKLISSERYIIVVAFVLAAIISPTPDAINQTMIAVPIIVVYQFGVIGVWLSIRKKRKLARKAVVMSKTPPTPPPSSPPQIPPSVLESMPAIPQLVSPAPTKRPLTTMSMDGFRPPKPQMVTAKVQKTANGQIQHQRITKVIPKQALSAEQIDRDKVVVPRRNPGLISDFGPIRRSAIDIAH